MTPIRKSRAALPMVLLALGGLGGCASWSPTQSIKSPGLPSHPWRAQPWPCGQGTCDAQKASQALAVAQSYCMELREYHQRGSLVTGSQRLFVGVLGSLAGSVFAVTAGGTASKAWAGLSGATNGLQTQIDTVGRQVVRPKSLKALAEEQQKIHDELKPLVEAKDWDKVAGLALVIPDRCGVAASRGAAEDDADPKPAPGSAAGDKSAEKSTDKPTNQATDPAKATPSAPDPAASAP